MVAISGQFCEIVELYSAETDEGGLLVTDDFYEAKQLAEAEGGYVKLRRYKYDGDDTLVADFREQDEQTSQDPD